MQHLFHRLPIAHIFARSHLGKRRAIHNTEQLNAIQLSRRQNQHHIIEITQCRIALVYIDLRIKLGLAQRDQFRLEQECLKLRPHRLHLHRPYPIQNLLRLFRSL